MAGVSWAVVRVPSTYNCSIHTGLRVGTVNGKVVRECVPTNPKVPVHPSIPTVDEHIPIRIGLFLSGLAIVWAIFLSLRSD
jgi:hypothetical protein